jgi:ubiquinone/menaquinone biosynthesis C-methylase UbiE
VDVVSKIIDKIFRDAGSYSWIQRFPLFSDPKVKVIASEVEVLPAQKVLDIGCGTGDRSDIFPPGCFVGIDINLEVVSFARHRYKREFLNMDALQLGLKNSSVDWILAVGFFHHLPDVDALTALYEANRVLTSSGRMFVLTVIWPLSRWNIIGRTIRRLDRGDYIRTSDEYAILFSEHFDIERQYPIRVLFWDIVAFVLIPRNNR